MTERSIRPAADYLDELAARFFGPSVPVVWERMTDGVSTVVYRATRGAERFYLRILPEADATFAPEARAHQLARQLGCAVPEVLAYEAQDPVLERSTMLTTEIPGQPLDPGADPAVVRAAMMAAGRDLARINSIAVDGLGWVDRGGAVVPEELSGEHPELDAALAAEYRPALEHLPVTALPGLPRGRVLNALEAAFEHVRGDKPARLAHGDFDTSHIFVHEGAYAGIIDFGEMRGMPATYDLGHHLLHDCERLALSTVGWLLAGYAEISPDVAADREQIRAWSILIAACALQRGIEKDPDSAIVAMTRRYLYQNVANS